MANHLEKILKQIQPSFAERYFADIISSHLEHFLENKELCDPKDNYAQLRAFLSDEVKFRKIEIRHLKKYFLVYHENTWKYAKELCRLYQEILKIL